MESIKNWLIKKGVMGGLFPGLFDLPELWQLNSKRCRGFNIIFFWLYPLWAIVVLVPTLLSLVEALLKNNKEEEEKNLKHYYVQCEIDETQT